MKKKKKKAASKINKLTKLSTTEPRSRSERSVEVEWNVETFQWAKWIWISYVIYKCHNSKRSTCAPNSLGVCQCAWASVWGYASEWVSVHGARIHKYRHYILAICKRINILKCTCDYDAMKDARFWLFMMFKSNQSQCAHTHTFTHNANDCGKNEKRMCKRSIEIIHFFLPLSLSFSISLTHLRQIQVWICECMAMSVWVCVCTL